MKKFLCMMLSIVLIAGLLAGCGDNGKGNTVNESDSSKPDSSAAANHEPSDGPDNGELTPLKMCLYAFGGNISDEQKVVDEINAYIRPLINAELEIEWINIGAWTEQINLKLNGGQQIDLMPSFGGSVLASLYGQEAILPLDSLLDQYGQEIIEAVGREYVEAGKMSGQLYSIPSLHEFAGDKVFLYRKDIADKYDLDFSSVKTVRDLEPMLELIRDNEDGMDPVVSGGNGTVPMLANFAWDGLGDNFGVLMDPVNNLQIENLFETEYYKDLLTVMRDWYNKGLVAKDAATNQEGYDVLMRADRAFGAFVSSKPGFIQQEEQKIGYEMATVELSPALAMTQVVTTVNWCIPVTSEAPEKAMQFLNLMYSDPVVANLLSYGIESVHYEIVDEENQIAGYPEGVDYTTSTYAPGMGWVLGNQFITHVWEGNEPDIWQQTIEFNQTAQLSKAMGFNFDSEAVQNEMTAVNNVTAKYQMGLEAGSLDPETELPKFIDELKGAGIDTIITEKQRQLDAWAAENDIE